MSDVTRVLVVDDEEEVREVLARQIGRFGFRCATASSGEDALTQLRQDPFDIVLLDLVMPDMDGKAVLSAIREEELETTVVVLSGYGTIGSAVETMKLGAFDFIEKGIPSETLRVVLERAGNHHDLRRRSRQMETVVQQWEATFDAVPDLVAILDDQHRFVRINRAMSQRLGISQEEAAGLPCYRVIHGKDAPPARCPHTRLMRDGRAHVGELAESSLGGCFVESASPLRDASGKLIGSVHVARDVTEQRRARDELERSVRLQQLVNSVLAASLTEGSLEQQLDAALETILAAPFLPLKPKGGVFVVEDDSGTLVLKVHRALDPYLTTACARLPFGRCLCGRAAQEQRTVFAGGVDDRHEITYAGMQPHGHYCVPIISSDKTIGVIVLYVKHGHTDSPQEQQFLEAAAGALAGLIERKRAEERISQAHREMQRLLSSMSSFLIEVDNESRVTRWNAAAESLFGLAADETLGKPIRECRIPWDWTVIRAELDSWMRSEQALRLAEVRFRRRDGNEGFLGITVNPIRDDAGSPSGLFLMGADITERRVLEAQLVQAQKLESIGQLAAGIAHEINTPIQYVGDNVEFLRSAIEDMEKVRRALQDVFSAVRDGTADNALLDRVASMTQEIDVAYYVEQVPRAIQQSLEGVGRVAAIVQAMKEFSHPGNQEKVPVDLNHCVLSTITVSRNEWKYVAEMETELDPTLPLVSCLPGEFNQVILNIIVNAAHAIGEVVGDGARGKGRITVRTRKDGPWALIEIGDTGPGIPEEIQGRVFDPFFTTKGVGRGTGQGLAIARNVVVDKHGGRLTFDTKAGVGTTFSVRLPLDRE